MGQISPNQRQGINISAGTGNAQTGTVVMSNSNGITFGAQLSASSFVITASANTVGVALSAGTTQAVSGTVVFSNSNGISFGMNASTVTAQLNKISYWDNGNNSAGANSIAQASTTSNLSFQRISFANEIDATRADLIGSLFVAGSTAGSFTLSIGAYTISHSTLSSVSSTSMAVTWNSGTNSTATSIYGGQSGFRWRSISLGTWNLTPGEYMLGLMGSVAGVAGTTGTLQLLAMTQTNVLAPGGGNYSSVFAAGIYSTGTGAFPAAVQLSEINQTASVMLPYVALVGTF